MLLQSGIFSERDRDVVLLAQLHGVGGIDVHGRGWRPRVNTLQTPELQAPPTATLTPTAQR
jgi:hypothetical protein